MKIIKLDAVDSTNSFLKEMAQKIPLENYTTVMASHQKKGKGQMETQWISEPYKNLLCSVFIAFDKLLIVNQILLNYAVSISILEVLEKYNLPKLQIKWPNDILSSGKKICGLLIENTVQNGEIKSTVIGIGININQTQFSENLSNVTSIKNIVKKEVDIDKLIKEILRKLKINIGFANNSDKNLLEKKYLNVLYKKDIPTVFKDSNEVLFTGIIVGVSSFGKLQIKLKDDSIKEFGIKEVSFA